MIIFWVAGEICNADLKLNSHIKDSKDFTLTKKSKDFC